MIDFDKVQKLDVLVEGVRVSVSLDEHGNSLTISTGAWLGGDDERRARLATAVAEARIQQAAARKAEAEAAVVRKANAESAAEASAIARAGNAETHWSRDYLERAYKEEKERGKTPGWRKLIHCARILAATEIPLEKRNEITEHYAREFLKKPRTT